MFLQKKKLQKTVFRGFLTVWPVYKLQYRLQSKEKKIGTKTGKDSKDTFSTIKKNKKQKTVKTKEKERRRFNEQNYNK